MKRNIEKLAKNINHNKKKIIKIVSILGAVVITLIIACTIGIYSIAKSNINYTEEQAKEIALKVVPGEVIKIEKYLEMEDLIFEYDIKIKDNNNMLKEVTVDSSLGVITDLDGFND